MYTLILVEASQLGDVIFDTAESILFTNFGWGNKWSKIDSGFAAFDVAMLTMRAPSDVLC